jgi:large subunit ribosomal protein L9
LKQADKIRSNASVRRTQLNSELGGLSDKVNGTVLTFASKAGETGKLYGSITNQMIAEALNSKLGTEIDRRAVEIQPVRTLGEHKAKIRLTMDLVPEIKIIVHREGESVAIPAAPAAHVTPAAEKPAAVEATEVTEVTETVVAAE